MTVQGNTQFFARKRCLAALVFCSTACLAQDTTPIVLHYYERKPFQYTAEDGQVAGLVVEPAIKVFSKAGIPITWTLTPVNRIFATHKANSGPDCSSGWYKTTERESIGKFTLPIYRDKPFAGLIRADSEIPSGISAKDLLARPNARLLVKLGLVYGGYLDALVAKMAPQQVISVSSEIPNMVQMIRIDRADLTFMTAEELDYLVGQSGFKMKDFRVLYFPDVPSLEMRYIMCSKQVSDETIKKLNEAILSTIHLK